MGPRSFSAGDLFSEASLRASAATLYYPLGKFPTRRISSRDRVFTHNVRGWNLAVTTEYSCS